MKCSAQFRATKLFTLMIYAHRIVGVVYRESRVCVCESKSGLQVSHLLITLRQFYDLRHLSTFPIPFFVFIHLIDILCYRCKTNPLRNDIGGSEYWEYMALQGSVFMV